MPCGVSSSFLASCFFAASALFSLSLLCRGSLCEQFRSSGVQCVCGFCVFAGLPPCRRPVIPHCPLLVPPPLFPSLWSYGSYEGFDWLPLRGPSCRPLRLSGPMRSGISQWSCSASGETRRAVFDSIRTEMAVSEIASREVLDDRTILLDRYRNGYSKLHVLKK